MSLRTDVQFRSGFPDDAVWADDDDIVEWPGRNIAQALKIALERAAYEVSEPICAEHKGWELDIRRGRESLWLQVSVVDASECYLIAGDPRIRLWPNDRSLRTFLTDLQRVLEGDKRFDVVGWFHKGSGGAGKPAASPFDP